MIMFASHEKYISAITVCPLWAVYERIAVSIPLLTHFVYGTYGGDRYVVIGDRFNRRFNARIQVLDSHLRWWAFLYDDMDIIRKKKN